MRPGRVIGWPRRLQVTHGGRSLGSPEISLGTTARRTSAPRPIPQLTCGALDAPESGAYRSLGHVSYGLENHEGFLERTRVWRLEEGLPESAGMSVRPDSRKGVSAFVRWSTCAHAEPRLASSWKPPQPAEPAKTVPVRTARAGLVAPSHPPREQEPLIRTYRPGGQAVQRRKSRGCLRPARTAA